MRIQTKILWPNYIANLGFSALPSTYEGFGIPYIEAMASGTPVVATPNAGAREILEDGKWGVLARPSELGSTLLSLLNDPPKRRSLAQHGLKRAECLFTGPGGRCIRISLRQYGQQRASRGLLAGGVTICLLSTRSLSAFHVKCPDVALLRLGFPPACGSNARRAGIESATNSCPIWNAHYDATPHTLCRPRRCPRRRRTKPAPAHDLPGPRSMATPSGCTLQAAVVRRSDRSRDSCAPIKNLPRLRGSSRSLLDLWQTRLATFRGLPAKSGAALIHSNTVRATAYASLASRLASVPLGLAHARLLAVGGLNRPPNGPTGMGKFIFCRMASRIVTTMSQRRRRAPALLHPRHQFSTMA